MPITPKQAQARMREHTLKFAKETRESKEYHAVCDQIDAWLGTGVRKIPTDDFGRRNLEGVLIQDYREQGWVVALIHRYLHFWDSLKDWQESDDFKNKPNREREWCAECGGTFSDTGVAGACVCLPARIEDVLEGNRG